MFCEKGVLGNFGKFTGKHRFLVNFAKFLKTPLVAASKKLTQSVGTISPTNFAILFSLENIKRERDNFLK